MKQARSIAPQQSLLYRLIAFGTRFQFGSLLRRVRNRQLVVLPFVFASGAVSLAIITLAAFLTQLPLLFPPLGPSAFILFRTPLAAQASPRNVICSHALALAAGVLSLWLVQALHPTANVADPTVMNGPRILAIALAMGVTSAAMILCRCMHPPAAATALLGAMAYFSHYGQMLGLLAAVVLLVAQAYLFNRVLGGLPYPLWRVDPTVVRNYGSLAGLPDGGGYWQQLSERLQRR